MWQGCNALIRTAAHTATGTVLVCLVSQLVAACAEHPHERTRALLSPKC